jgi:hypothetical protein
MTLSEHIKKEQLEKVVRAWDKLNWFQRKWIVAKVLLHTLPRSFYRGFVNYLEYRRAKYAYWFPAHWIGRKS